MKSFKKLMGNKSGGGGGGGGGEGQGHGKGKDKAPQSTPSPKNAQVLSTPILPPGNYGSFPPSFNIYLAGTSPDKKTEFFTLCQDPPQGQPTALNAIAIFKGTVKHHLTIHSGPRYDSPPLALGGTPKYFSGTIILALPAPAGAAPTNQIVRLDVQKSWTADLHNFNAVVGGAGAGAGVAAERFDWRGDDVRIRGKKPIFERKLFRLRGSSAPGSAEDEELVGVWADEKNPHALAAGRLGGFGFHGSGATGELGPYWTLLVVASCVKLFGNTWEARAAVDKMIEAAPGLLGAGLGLGFG